MGTLADVLCPSCGHRWSPSVPLSPREVEVAVLISQGETNRRIARVLGCAESTIKGYVQNLFRKLEVESRLQLGLLVVRGDPRFHREEGELSVLKN